MWRKHDICGWVCMRCGFVARYQIARDVHERRALRGLGCSMEGNTPNAEVTGLGRNRSDDDQWLRGYYCAVALLLREAGFVTTEVRSLYEQGGDASQADPDDVELFAHYGLHA